MKKLLAAILAALFIAVTACAENFDLFDGEFLWTTKPNSDLHMFISCPVLGDEMEYELIVGTPDQATADGKATVCRLCFIRAARALGAEPAAASHTLMQDLSDEDLRYLCQVAQLEVLSRISDPITLLPGIYVVGQDIPEGEWRFDLVANAAELAVYKDNATYTQQFGFPYFDVILGIATNEYSVGRLYLSDGNIVFIDGTLQISPYTGVADPL